MASRFLAEVALVLPLHFGHGQQAVDDAVLAAGGGEHGGVFVLDDVVALQAPRAVDRREPAADVAERGDELADAEDILGALAEPAVTDDSSLAEEMAATAYALPSAVRK